MTASDDSEVNLFGLHHNSTYHHDAANDSQTENNNNNPNTTFDQHNISLSPILPNKPQQSASRSMSDDSCVGAGVEDKDPVIVLCDALYRSTSHCSDRCLPEASEWSSLLLSQLLLLLNNEEVVASQSTAVTYTPPHRPELPPAALVAHTLFQSKQLARAAHWIHAVRTNNQPVGSTAAVEYTCTCCNTQQHTSYGRHTRSPTHCVTVFLEWHLKMLVAQQAEEQHQQEQQQEQQQQKHTLLLQLQQLQQQIEQSHQGDGVWCPFIHYLYAGVLAQQQDLLQSHNTNSTTTQTIIAHLVESVNKYPLNWSAWLLLSASISTTAQLYALQLQPHWVTRFFFVEALLRLPQHQHQHQDLLELLAHIQNDFPTTTTALSYEARIHYRAKNYNVSEKVFSSLYHTDPFLYKHIDLYSHVLFLNDNISELSILAHNNNRSGDSKYTPEVCCVIGNYYAAKKDHANAVRYFNRAVKLDSSHSSAWVLMGHEYLQMRNAATAIECYRKSVEVDPQSYSGWYGLGLAYEMKKMYTYSLYNYKKSLMLQPNDSQLWLSFGECCTYLHRYHDAIMALKRAVTVGAINEGSMYHDGEHSSNALTVYAITACQKVAILLQQQQQYDEAAHYFLMLSRIETTLTVELAEYLLWLAEYLKSKENFNECERICRLLMLMQGSFEEKAKVVLSTIRRQ